MITEHSSLPPDCHARCLLARTDLWSPAAAVVALIVAGLHMCAHNVAIITYVCRL